MVVVHDKQDKAERCDSANNCNWQRPFIQRDLEDLEYYPT
jgi:hypothetical protein